MTEPQHNQPIYWLPSEQSPEELPVQPGLAYNPEPQPAYQQQPYQQTQQQPAQPYQQQLVYQQPPYQQTQQQPVYAPELQPAYQQPAQQPYAAYQQAHWQPVQVPTYAQTAQQQALYPQQPYYQQQYVAALPNPKTSYKKMLRRAIMLISIALFVFYVINMTSSVIFGMGYIVFSDALEDFLRNANPSSAFSYADGPGSVYEAFPFGWASIVGIILGALIFFMVRGKRLVTNDLSQINSRIVLSDFLLLLGLLLGFQAFIGVFSLVIQMLMDIATGEPVEVNGVFDFYMNIPGLLYIVLIGPIFEEVIFRGAILRTLLPYGRNFAIVLSSLLFAVYHLNLFQGVFAFFAGLILAYCTVRFSMKWSILLHIANNALASLLMYLSLDYLVELGLYVLLLVVAFAVVISSLTRFKAELRLGKPVPIAIVTGIRPEMAAAGVMSAAAGMVPGAAGMAGAMPEATGMVPGMYWPVSQPQVGSRASKPPAYAVAFSSAWLIVGLSLSLLIMLFTFL